ncbi:hypothetical protein [Erwinia psidii]|uniref:hypothetical protein n=1 Tax=Erwinia psidii TaxID=69224 RepID=UPI00226B59B8|nr:hypothetical protein [Erwinia psidii]
MLHIFIASTQSMMLNIWLFAVNVFLIVGLSFVVVTVVFATPLFNLHPLFSPVLFTMIMRIVSASPVSMVCDTRQIR